MNASVVPSSRPAVWRGVIESYRTFLPVSSRTPIVTLLEGNTPLLYSRVLSERLKDPFQVDPKLAGASPTGSV